MRPDQQHSASEAEPLFDDGGPAFPYSFTDVYGHVIAFNGMSLRDYFAGQASIALGAGTAHPQSPGITEEDYAACAEQAYEFADAMLEARK